RARRSRSRARVSFAASRGRWARSARRCRPSSGRCCCSSSSSSCTYGPNGCWHRCPGGFGVDQHLILPAIALAMRPAAYIFRTTATALDEARHAPHVITAWAKGLGPPLVARRHVARNAAPAVLAGMALGAKTALSSLAIVEFVFTWNGAGYAFILSVATGNVAFASAIALVFAVALT